MYLHIACRSPWMLVQPGICPRCFVVSNTASVGEGEPRRHEGEQGSQQHTAKGPRQGTGTSTRRGGERRLWDWIHGPFGNGWCIEYCSGCSGLMVDMIFSGKMSSLGYPLFFFGQTQIRTDAEVSQARMMVVTGNSSWCHVANNDKGLAVTHQRF